MGSVGLAARLGVAAAASCVFVRGRCAGCVRCARPLLVRPARTPPVHTTPRRCCAVRGGACPRRNIRFVTCAPLSLTNPLAERPVAKNTLNINEAIPAPFVCGMGAVRAAVECMYMRAMRAVPPACDVRRRRCTGPSHNSGARSLLPRIARSMAPPPPGFARPIGCLCMVRVAFQEMQLVASVSLRLLTGTARRLSADGRSAAPIWR